MSNDRCATKACPFPREYGSTHCAKCNAMEHSPQYFLGTSITAATMESWNRQLAGLEHEDPVEEEDE